MKTLASKIYPGMSANYWVYVNPGADTTRGAPLMVWQDGETIVGIRICCGCACKLSPTTWYTRN